MVVDVDEGANFETFTVAAEQGQSEGPALTDQAVVDEEALRHPRPDFLFGNGESGNLVWVDPVVAALVAHGADLAVANGQEDLCPRDSGCPGCFGDLHAIGHGLNR